MLVVQPTSIFGDLICAELASEHAGQLHWETFEFAVAWLNRAGAAKLRLAAERFLADAKRIYATVGLDFGSTTYEALSTLLDIEDGSASITTHVFCDENPACTFHPKIFLFHNAKSARLFVGSNNMTGAGLSTNVEASLGYFGEADDEDIRDARSTLAAWRDEKREPRTRRLTRELLEQLRAGGYVLTESELRSRRKSEAKSRAAKGKPLFGRSKTRLGVSATSSSSEAPGASTTASVGTGETLLMRVRKRRNGNQLQISMLIHGSFMRSAASVVSASGVQKEIGYNEAHGVKNTARFEAPEMKAMKNPVAQFTWSKNKKVLQYQIFDADKGGKGSKILKQLKDGIQTPPTTNLAKLSHTETVVSKSNLAIAQWYRLASV
jgi:HKD family nuclease